MCVFFFSSRRRHTRCALVTGVKTCALPIHTSFPQSVKLKPGEVVVFAWIVYKSPAQRDRINKKVMADPRLAGMNPKSMPVDGKRMIWGGLRPAVELGGGRRGTFESATFPRQTGRAAGRERG